MDELSALPPTLRKRPSRLRHSSSGYAPSSSPTSTRDSDSPVSHPRPLEILAPKPQRHLLESSASQHWLRTPPLSPSSSRAASPVSVAGSTTTNSSHVRGHRPRSLSQHTSTSFSALLLQHNARLASSPRPGSTPRTHAQPQAQEPPPEQSAGRRWIRWMHKRGLRHWVAPLAVLAALLVKTSIGLGSYSGAGTPPMFGDYEAQRHWMELTVHLPVREWYTHDLQYWGLDYPPLTAYVSWLCGAIGSRIEPAWFALGTSRGIETPGSKFYMRTTVLVLDALVYVPALLMFAATWQGTRSKRTQHIALLTLLFQPALLLIDSGHFQYNSVMLGLTLLALNFFAAGRDLAGAVCFVLSLGFKQMALYYAPAIGSYLLAKCIYLGPTHGTRLFARLALVTTTAFLLLFLPFLPPFAPLTAIRDPLTRIFPFARGLFEDKVANFWCASDVVVKWRRRAGTRALVRLAAGLTAVGFLPGVGVLIRAGWVLRVRDVDAGGKEVPAEGEGGGEREGAAMAGTERQAKVKALALVDTHAPFLPLLPYALLNSALAFFLFSFQVHEKTILLPLLPITLLLSAAQVDSAVYAWGVLVNNVAVFSMWPLLKRDGLGAQYIAMLVIWNRLVGHNPFRVPSKSFIQVLSTAVYSAAALLHVLELVVSPPARYPDIYAVLNVLVCTPVFVLALLWSAKSGVEVGWALGGLGGAGTGGKARGGAVERRRMSVGDVPVEGQGSYRQLGGRAVSLGFAESRKRAAYVGSSRGSSVTGGE
ncbi:hypothetical protein H0H81_012625 [Sphagnurus paluster]|uniref:Alpha-1,3-glucosyltransferase n=1 Tax=Sphagnurus paluster TaxID=117069 RepID=A0A9P7K4N6_9AGAR|nr:hypothetical protein H0H81_012625 [Sphagnurus paluster]